METTQHVQLPTKLEGQKLQPKDQLVYLELKKFGNNCFPSLKTMAKDLNTSIDTIRKSLKTLEKEEYITITKQDNGKKNVYTFNPYKTFEPFSYEFLNSDLPFELKAYVAASQQYMYKDNTAYQGRISFTDDELANRLNISRRSVLRYNQQLTDKGLLTTLKGSTNIPIKVFDMQKLMQGIVFTLKDHEDRLTKLEKENEELKRMLKLSLSELNKIQSRPPLIA